MISISIIIPNYNGEDLLKKNLLKVLEAVEFFHKKTGLESEIIIADDGSTDASASVISNIQYQISNIQLKLIQNEQNLGFASAVNIGVKEASGEILVLLNTDVVPQRDFLEHLLEHFKDESVFAVGCMDKSIEGSKTILRGRGIGKWEKGFLVHSRGEVEKTNTLWVSGGSGAFRKSIWNKLGGLSELYNPFYWEDIDLSYRALKCGYKVLFEPESIVIHKHEEGSIKKKYSGSKIKSIAYRNQFIFSWINITDLSLRILHVFWLPYHLFRALIRLDIQFFKGFFDALIKMPKIIQSRNKIKKHLLKTDEEIIKDFFH